MTSRNTKLALATILLGLFATNARAGTVTVTCVSSPSSTCTLFGSSTYLIPATNEIPEPSFLESAIELQFPGTTFRSQELVTIKDPNSDPISPGGTSDQVLFRNISTPDGLEGDMLFVSDPLTGLGLPPGGSSRSFTEGTNGVVKSLGLHTSNGFVKFTLGSDGETAFAPLPGAGNVSDFVTVSSGSGLALGPVALPEPASLTLLASGMLTAAAYARRRKKQLD